MPFWTQKNNDIYLFVKVSPGAKKSRFISKEEDFVKIAVKAPPQKGEANEALIWYLSTSLKIAKSKISIYQGFTSKLKTVIIKDCPWNLIDDFFNSSNAK